MRGRSRDEDSLVPQMPKCPFLGWPNPCEPRGGRATVHIQPPDSTDDLGVTSFPHAPCLPCHKSSGPNVMARGVEDNKKDLAVEDASGLSESVTRFPLLNAK